MKSVQVEAFLNEILLRFIDFHLEPLVIFDPERYEILYLNEKARDFLGNISDLSALFQEDEYLNFIKLIRDCYTIEEKRVISFKREGNTKGILLFNLYPIAFDNYRTVIFTFCDITEKIKHKEEKRRKNAQLILQDKLKSIDFVTSSISHEINNICNFMINNFRITFQAWNDVLNLIREYEEENGEFIVGGISSSEVDKVIPRLMISLIDGINRISDTIDNFKRYVREGLKSDFSLIFVNDVIRRVVAILNHHIVLYTENFNINLEESLPKIKGNLQKLEQVIINLLINALQSLPDRQRGVYISTGLEGEKVYIEIKDEGMGIPKHIMPYIFEPFFSTKYSTGGSGLGLYLSKSIIEEFGGEIIVNSEENIGTTVKVYLPHESIQYGKF
ncbi:MAG: ATP-binding protein [Thermodesulfovibrio sp.]|nr:ATP-binding protein [Thermodesulfovibrio sp.]